MLRSCSDLDCISILIIKVSLPRRFIFNRVHAPEGELLFATKTLPGFRPAGQPHGCSNSLQANLCFASAIAPALLSIAVPDAILPRQPLPALLYLLRPCSRPPSLGSYLLHPCSRKESNQRKGDPVAALLLCSSAKAPVLGAAHGVKNIRA